MATAIQTKAKIDISKKRMDFHESFRNAYVLILVLILSSICAFVGMKGFYNLNLILAMIFTGIEYFAYCFYPQYRLKLDFLQLKFSAKTATFIKISAMVFRLILILSIGSLTPFALNIAQVLAQMYQVVFVNIVFHKNYRILKNGRAIRKALKK